MEEIENTQNKNVSYLRARDPSIIAWNYHLSDVRTNLDSELARPGSSASSNFGISNNAEEDADHIQVYLRIKKCENFKELYDIVDGNTLVCKVPEDAHCVRNVRNGSSITKKFTFSKIFDPQSKQIDLFNSVVKEKVLRFINGYNCSLLTYGASGSGKTFTIIGTADEPGIVPRALEYLFRTLPKLPEQPCIKPRAGGGVIRLAEPDCKLERNACQSLLKTFNTSIDQHTRTYKQMQHRLSREPVALIMDDISDVSLGVWVSYAEIYNEYIYDLLKPAPLRGQQKQKLRLGYANGKAYIKGLTCLSVSSGLEAFHILQYGLHNLKYAATSINDHSSRSHSIFTIILAQASNTEEGVGVSLFNFCDLAGSERLKNTHNVGVRLKESNNINTSLLVLGRCISLVRESQKCKNNKPIPFRDSKLTQLFQKALMGQEAIAMMVNINPVRNMFDETQHVLQFSAVAKDVVVEQYQIIRPPCRNRFSEYMESKTTDFSNQRSQSDDSNIDVLQQQVVLLYNELEQHKLDAQEEKEHVINTYKKILSDTNKYWENRCENLRDVLARTMRQSNESAIQPLKKQRLSVVILDSDSEEENGHDVTANNKKPKEDICKPEDSLNLVLLKTELEKLKSRLEEKDAETQKLTSEKKALTETLKDAKKAYQELELHYQNENRKLYSDLLKKEEKIVELNRYIEVQQKRRAEIDEDKENSESLLNQNSEQNVNISEVNTFSNSFWD